MPERRLPTIKLLAGIKDRIRLGMPSVLGARVSEGEMTEQDRLAQIPGTKAHADGARGDIPFDRVDLHRKRRKKGGE